MNKYLKPVIISAVMVIFSIAGVVSAQAADCGELGDDCFTRWYLGVTGGEGTISSADLATSYTAVDEADLSYGFVFGRRLNRFFGMEMAGNYFGEPEFLDGVNPLDTRICNLGVGFNVYLPLGEVVSDPDLNFISIFGRGGMHFWDAEGQVAGVTVFDDNGVDAFYGGGLNIDLSRFMALRAEYTTYELGSDDDVSTKSLTVIIKF